MSNLMERVSRLKGMAAAMKPNMDENAGKLMQEMLSLLGEMAEELQATSDALGELNDYVESLDDDLADLAESLLDGGDPVDEEFYTGDGDEDDEDSPLEDEELIRYACPHCSHEIEFNPSDVDFDEDYLCPACGKPIFPEIDEDE